MQIEFRKTTQESVFKIDYVEIQKDVIVPLLKYKVFEEMPIVNHCFSTRLGGVSKGIYESMNLSFSRGDDKQAVYENFNRIAKAMGENVNNFVFSDQTHTANVLRVTKKDIGSGIFHERNYENIDGLITNEKNVILSTFFADCVPLYFVDPVKKAIGLSHSGWKGTVQKIGEKTIEAMKNAFQSDPVDIFCAIGPSICKKCYEISEDVAQEFEHAFLLEKDMILEKKDNRKYQLDLWKANELILEHAGIKKEHMITTNICTCCNEKLLFSHRASMGKRGNLGAFLSLR